MIKKKNAAREQLCSECGGRFNDYCECDESCECGTCEACEDRERFAREWRRELAMEAGMLGGCGAYNDEMGW